MSARKTVSLSERDKECLLKAQQFICTDLSRNYTIPEIARYVNINRYKLTYGFKLIFGMTIHDMIVMNRMNNAKRLLTETDLPLKQIAKLCGYSNHNNFSHAFKKFYEYKPSSLRKVTGV